MLTTWSFNNIENNYTLYHWEDCMKKFFKSLRQQVKKIIDFEKKITPRCKNLLDL